MKRSVILLWALPFVVLGSAWPAAAQQAAPAPKKRVAVLSFDFGTVSRWWSGDWDVGKGISDVLVTGLVKDGTYSVIERKMLDEVLKEQDLGNSNRVDAGTAAKVGKILGVNAIIVGSITQFGFDDKKLRIGAAGGVLGGFGLGGLTKKKSKAIVAVDARIIDTTTAEILAVASATGESRRDSFGGFGAGGAGGAFGAAGIDMSSSNFQNTIIGEATRKCVESLCAELVKQEARLPAAPKVQVAGRVADVDKDTLILNVGKSQGVKVGDVLDVERVVREVKDPDTGKVLREVTEVIGTVTITQVDEQSAVGTYKGTGVPKVGDRVKSK
ncbi:MAG: curli production assembly protein CsgG [Armatimonadetes bacterium]|nr:curli production assembly protein CsgG [Armatimonadota bacterium]